MTYIQHAQALTALGDAAVTSRAMSEGQIALKLEKPVALESDEALPLAWMGDAPVAGAPRWTGHLHRLRDGLPDRPWGHGKYPVFVTSSNYGIDHLFQYSQEPDPALVDWMSPHLLVARLRELFGWGPQVTVFSHACVTGQLGLLQAERAVESGVADEALVFSFDFLSPFVIGGFHSLKILNGGMPAPYHDGAVGSIGLGEGAGAVVIGREPTPYKIEGQSLYNEMYHFTSNEPDGAGFDKIFRSAAELAGERRVWVKGHGTGTLEAGQLEALAVERLFPESRLVSWKGSLGHTLGSCAVVELAVALESIQAGKIPGNLGAAAPFFSNVVAPDAFRADDFSAVVLTSNAFGGAHAAMVVSYE